MLETVAAYRAAMASFATMDNLDGLVRARGRRSRCSRARVAVQTATRPSATETDARKGSHARQHVRVREADRTTSTVERGSSTNPPLIVPIASSPPTARRDDCSTQLHELLRPTAHARVRPPRPARAVRLVDFARKVVGVGSVGTRAWIALMLGRDDSDPLFLQMKEAEAVGARGVRRPSEFDNHGERVVAGQRLMQADQRHLPRLAARRSRARRNRDATSTCASCRDWKGSADDRADGRPTAWPMYGRLCGWTLARAHARSGDRVAIAAYLGSGDSFDRAIAGVLAGLRRPERARLRSARGRRPIGQDHGASRPVTAPVPGRLQSRVRRSR